MKNLFLSAFLLCFSFSAFASTYTYRCTSDSRGGQVELVINNGHWVGQSIKFSDLSDGGRGPTYPYAGDSIPQMDELPLGNYTLVGGGGPLAGLIIEQSLYEGLPTGTMAQTRSGSSYAPSVVYNCERQ